MNASQPGPASTAPPARASMSSTLIASALIAALGGFLFGYDTVVISGTLDSLKRVFVLSEGSLGFTVAIALIGTIVGSIVAGRPADIWGRKKALIVLAVLYLVTSLGTALAWDWYSFLFFRFWGGVAVGGASVVSPLYIAEISPARFRGRLVAVQQFNIVFGILLAQLLNYAIARMGLGENEWRWMLAVLAAPSLAFLILMVPTLESPRWLIGRGREDEARAALLKLGVDGGGVEQEVAEIRASIDPEHHKEGDSLLRPAYRIPVMLAVAIAMFNQLSGINAVLYYAPKIFEMARGSKDTALLQAVAIGGMNMVFTMLAMTVIDRAGRRALMLVGSIGYILGLSVTAWAFYTYGANFTPAGGAIVLGGLLLFIAAHGFGQGAVIWVFISEIFPNRVRADGQALGSTTHWVMAAAISWTFPIINERFGPGNTFAFYAAMMVLQLLWVLTIMPETKGVPLEEMQKRLGIE
ncbi:D-xylose-proton symporter [Aquisphaera giovannonii]|uniref:D-xylose-proton symporter n=1 Tax=Aquisphaera giovannonii TaxID=406548 RepID=A0A5B9WCM6_9BACT|nr:sugar porter family MFS transporter [Aquisphaera giovannonii]QEH38277.1 D-xylose-proton symporter [Aquisphaera giovannonii]